MTDKLLFLTFLFQDALRDADLTTVMDGLNVLGRVPWVINKNVLSAAERCWDEGIVLGDIPSKVDHDLPPMPLRPEGNNKDYKEAQGEFQSYREALVKYRRIHQRNMVRTIPNFDFDLSVLINIKELIVTSQYL